jgi:hypothetical protein
MDELEHRVQHDIFVSQLSEHGCLYGKNHIETMKAAVDYIEKRFESKFESAEAAAIACTEITHELKREVSEVKSMARDAVACTHVALASVEKSVAERERFVSQVETELRGLWLKSGLASATGAAAVISAAFILFKLFSGRP